MLANVIDIKPSKSKNRDVVLLGPCLGSCGPSQLSLRLTDDSEKERKELSVNDPK